MKTLLASVLTLLLSFQMIFPIFAADTVTTTDQPVAADRAIESPTIENRVEPIATDSNIRATEYADPSVAPTVSSVQTGSQNQIQYPDGREFESLKKIIDAKFIASRSKDRYGYTTNCILDGRFCPNYRYTSIDEKAIKLIVLKTFIGNESFYTNIFTQNSTDSYTRYSYSNDDNQSNGLQDILKRVPIGTAFLDWKVPNFGNTLG